MVTKTEAEKQIKKIKRKTAVKKEQIKADGDVKMLELRQKYKYIKEIILVISLLSIFLRTQVNDITGAFNKQAKSQDIYMQKVQLVLDEYRKEVSLNTEKLTENSEKISVLQGSKLDRKEFIKVLIAEEWSKTKSKNIGTINQDSLILIKSAIGSTMFDSKDSTDEMYLQQAFFILSEYKKFKELTINTEGE